MKIKERAVIKTVWYTIMEEVLQLPNSILQEMKRNDYLNNNTIYLDTEVDRDSHILFNRQLRKLAEQELKKREDERKPIKIYISSYGGSAWDFFGMVSMMEYYQDKGIIIETIVDGYACSAGAKLALCGSKGHRYITRYGRIILHQTQLGMGYATLQESKQTYKENMRDWESIKKIFRKHTKLTEQEIDDFTERNLDVTYDAEEAVEKGIADHIL